MRVRRLELVPRAHQRLFGVFQLPLEPLGLLFSLHLRLVILARLLLDGMQRLRLQQQQLELDSERKAVAFVRPQTLQGTSWRAATLIGKLGKLMDTVRLEDRQVEALCSASLALFGADAAPSLPRSERADAEVAAAAAASTRAASKSSTATKVGKVCKRGKVALAQQNDSARASLEQLQLASLRFLQCTFAHVQYSALRRYLVDELVTLMARLPTSKAALNGYRLPGCNDQHIQMHTPERAHAGR